MQYLSFTFLITLLQFAVTLIKSDVVSVVTNNGIVNGQTKEWDGEQVNEFLGIPYAEPPVGNLRFKKPVAVGNWSEAIDATQWQNPCYQIPLTNTLLNTNFSENCLYLNIWQPVNSNNQSKAVMFFIHGGGLIVGSAGEYQFQGQILSTKGDVVVVTVNYRLGSFGFLYSGTVDAPGNVGLWDQILALKWVRNNIKYFGGDKNQITIFGQSGGSWAVSIHILSPITRALYKQAILISGAEISKEIANQTFAKNSWLKAAKIIGCANESQTSFNSATISCLQNIDPSFLAAIPFFPQLIGNKVDTLQMVVIDGTILVDSPKRLFETRNYKRNLNLLVGRCEDEGSVLLAKANETYYSLTNPMNLTYEQAYNSLIEYTSRVNFYAQLNGEKIADIYFSVISPQSNDYNLLRRTVGIGFGDGFIGCETTIFAELVFKYDRFAKVFQYQYSSKFGEKQANQSVYYCGDWMGTCHGADLTPIYGLPFIYPESYFDAQREESLQVIRFVSHFAKYGYPSSVNGIEWQKYYKLNNHIVKPYLSLNNSVDTYDTSFSYGFKITECEYLWKKYLYTNVP